MHTPITAWTDERPPKIDEVVPFVSLNRQVDDRVRFSVRDRRGRQVDVEVPAREFRRMAQEISWEEPRRGRSAGTAAAPRG